MIFLAALFTYGFYVKRAGNSWGKTLGLILALFVITRAVTFVIEMCPAAIYRPVPDRIIIFFQILSQALYAAVPFAAYRLNWFGVKDAAPSSY